MSATEEGAESPRGGGGAEGPTWVLGGSATDPSVSAEMGVSEEETGCVWRRGPAGAEGVVRDRRMELCDGAEDVHGRMRKKTGVEMVRGSVEGAFGSL